MTQHDLRGPQPAIQPATLSTNSLSGLKVGRIASYLPHSSCLKSALVRIEHRACTPDSYYVAFVILWEGLHVPQLRDLQLRCKRYHYTIQDRPLKLFRVSYCQHYSDIDLVLCSNIILSSIHFVNMKGGFTLTAFAYWCGIHELTSFLPTIPAQPCQIEKVQDNGPREKRDGRWSRSVELLSSLSDWTNCTNI